MILLFQFYEPASLVLPFKGWSGGGEGGGGDIHFRIWCGRCLSAPGSTPYRLLYRVGGEYEEEKNTNTRVIKKRKEDDKRQTETKKQSKYEGQWKRVKQRRVNKKPRKERRK